MSGKARKAGRRAKGRSTAQREGSAAMAEVMMGWEELSDEERLAWRTEASNRRIEGVACFKQVNLRRVRRGQEWLRLPPVFKPYDGRPILKRLIILNKGGRIHLKLELYRAPTVPTTVWGALPCNRGKAKPNKCPRLGWLPAAEDGVCDITRQYFQKHGEYFEGPRRLQGCIKLGSANAGAGADVVLRFIFQIGSKRQ